MSNAVATEPRTAQPSVNHDTESLGGRLLKLSMLINLVMLTLAYAMLVMPVLWLARPVRMVNPF